MDRIPQILQWLRRLLWPGVAVILWAALGWIGHACVQSAWRTAQVDEFRRSVAAVASLASAPEWSEPWESDPAWQALEKQLKIDLVPLKEVSGSDVAWVRTPKGIWRVSVTQPLVVSQPPVAPASISAGRSPSSLAVHAVRGTREFDDHAFDLVWWSTWTLLNAVIWGAVLVVRRRQHQWLARERENIQAWQHNSDRAELLVKTQRVADLLQLVLGSLREGVMAIDDQARVLLVNRALCEQLAVVDGEQLTMRPLVEAIRAPAVIELLEHCLRTGQVSQQTIEVGTAGRYLHLLVMPLPIDATAPGVLLTATDVSSVQRSEIARREFIAGASHELKTPLAAIRAYTETLQTIGDEDPQATERFMQKILDQADRMDRLVNSMLQLARAESGTLKLKLKSIDVCLALKPCIEAAAGLAETHDIKFQADLPDQRTLAMADRDALQTIASNLLSNAVRYTQPGGSVRLELMAEPADGSICLRVTDTGIGISAADQKRIFERFYRVQKDRASDTGGTGLGLAIVKQLTQVLEGTIRVSSQPGQGTSFEIRLPGVGFTQSSSNTSS